ncbi:secretory calcium-binding phosphoprotein 5 isoform X2 [Eucyclogobius newberryi]|uniref:secretory calcium-binding phosphoprotein 5 isoform X2 n=1 Tax=Eucyclogobius newberryi TaxID=166745 RepID=UPI003B5C7777
MKVALLCLCLASTALAAPSFFHYLPHYTGSRQVPPSQALPHAGAYSVELIYPHTFGGAAAGGPTAGQSFPSQGFIKYSIPQPPGRQSVEVYYPYDFAQQRIITNIPPMSNVPQSPNVRPFDFPPQNIPLPPQNIPTFDAMPLPSQDPLHQALQDQPAQTSQAPAKV